MQNENTYNPYASPSREAAFPRLMQKTYLWMMFGLIMTALTATYVASNAALMQTIFTGSTFLILVIAELALVFFLSARIMTMSFPVAGILFAAYSILNGATLSVILLAYEPGVIATTFFVTAGMFGAMSLIGFFTARDLSGIGRFLIMALVGIIIASVVNIFLHSEGLYWAVSYLGVLVFAGLTAYDTQKIKQMLMVYGGEVNDNTQKLALLGSLTLYLDFINLFLFLLRIFGGSRD
ncbi:MAG: Bax inhibitor-1/YccA family protein [Alloprevotella sp.]|nr:Bax inhibitor-1/YccA family protein [Alloprevotella sp.]MDY2778475.1 Bax inhibitor-1/YccA family protein [Alloprevotella sp.]MDY6114243.1 Bax inhibitor-1/YccA family protein [Alloprevotella sp.]